MTDSTKKSVDVKQLIEEFNVPGYLREDAIREIWMAERDKRDVRVWLKYWLEQQEMKEEPFLVYVDPGVLDRRAWDEDNGLHYDQYHGFVRDDV